MTKITMRDVARLAEVSVATVSAVINGTATVSDARARRVREAMQALDYHPDQIARSLKVGRSGVIGMVVSDITNPFFPEVIRAVEDAARVENYSVILCNSNEDPEQERRHLSTLFSRRVDGVLLACSDASSAYDSLLRRRFPIVFVDRIPQGLAHLGVATDNLDASYQAARHLIGLGHRRIAFLAGRLSLSPHADRLDGFRRAMEEHNLPLGAEYLRHGDLRIETGYQLGLELMRLPEPPTAVLTSNNRMLLGLMRALGECRVPCPEAVSVVGFDDFAWTQHFTPRLTVVAQAADEMGRRATQMLLARIRAEVEGENETVLLKAELRVRESTAPVAQAKPSAASASR